MPPFKLALEPEPPAGEHPFALQMNGTDAGGVHGPLETILTGDTTGRPVAFEAFFEAERVRLFRALYLLTGNKEEAEEALQEAFIAIWERWDRVGIASANDPPPEWLVVTAHDGTLIAFVIPGYFPSGTGGSGYGYRGCGTSVPS